MASDGGSGGVVSVDWVGFGHGGDYPGFYVKIFYISFCSLINFFMKG